LLPKLLKLFDIPTFRLRPYLMKVIHPLSLVRFVLLDLQFYVYVLYIVVCLFVLFGIFKLFFYSQYILTMENNIFLIYCCKIVEYHEQNIIMMMSVLYWTKTLRWVYLLLTLYAFHSDILF
jgi:hypothetical protein